MKDCTADKKGSDTQVIEYSSPVKIFIVDNDGCFGRSLAELLHASGYFALLADSTDEARAIIRNNNFDIIISDANMPGMTCAELIIYSKKYHPLLEVIITSRKPEFAEALQAARDGAFDYIGKNRIFDIIRGKIEKTHHCQLDNLVKNIACRGDGEICEHLNTAFPGYEIIRRVGLGTTGIVMLAKRQEKYYALKLLRRELHDAPDGKELINRFLAESEAMSKIKHPHIVKIFESGFLSESGISYILMEYIDGGSLKDYICRDSLAFDRRIKIILQLCDALNTVHSCGMLHRDIKPANIMMQKNLSVKLSDFGIARTIDFNKNMKMEITGSPAYMAQEAFRGSHYVDQRSDIFSLGVVSYELLTGQRPFRGSCITDIVKAQKNQKTKIAEKQFASLPCGVQAMLNKMLKFNPEDRFQSAGEIIQELKVMIHNDGRRRPCKNNSAAC
ncbi:MAG: protein kinase [Lentisphaerota bacterium]